MAWVDTGAVYTVVPAELLGKCGIKKMGTKQTLISVEGKTFERSWGSALLSIQGTMTTIDVLFGEPSDPPLLDCVALEQAGFAVDPVKQRLVTQKFLQQY